MEIAVTTPTGNVGREVVAMLVRAGVRPRVLARDPDRIEPVIRDRVDAVAVDQFDSDAVVAATAGVDALYWVNPPTFAAPDPVAAGEQLGEVAARAVSTNGIGRTVFQSSMGAELRHGAGEIDGLARTEQLLDGTGASVTHLRCGYFFTNLLTALGEIRAGTLSVIVPVDEPTPWVAPRDIAEVAALRLLSREWSGRHVRAVHGPSDLSWREVVGIVSAATGQQLDVQRIPDTAMREGLSAAGMNDAQVEAIVGMSSGLRDGYVPEQPRDVTTTTPTSLAAWSYEVLRVALRAADQ